MAVTYQWLIGEIVVNDEGELKDVIKKIYWDYKATDSETNLSANSTRMGWINFGEADPNNFKPFNTFTKEEIEQWLDTHVNDLEGLKQDALENLESEKQREQRIKTKPAPWL